MADLYHFITAPKAAEPLSEAQAQQIADWLLDFQQNMPDSLAAYPDGDGEPAEAEVRAEGRLLVLGLYQSYGEEPPTCPKCNAELEYDWMDDIDARFNETNDAAEADAIPCPKCAAPQPYTEYQHTQNGISPHYRMGAVTSCWIELLNPTFDSLDEATLLQLEAHINRPLIYWCDKL